MIYISTDYVFRGDRGVYVEAALPDPVNFYGFTKLQGEKIVRTLVKDYCIVRTSVLYGSRPASGKINFALWLLETMRKGKIVKVVDQYASPTLNTNLAEMIVEVIERRLTGIYHLAGASRVSRIEMAIRLADEFSLNRNLVTKANIDDLPWVAKRPKDSSLNVSKASSTLRKKPLEFTKALTKLRTEMA